MPQLRLETSIIMKIHLWPIIHSLRSSNKSLLLRKKKFLMNSLKRQPWRDPNDTLTLNRKEITLSNSIRWNIRQRCVGIGSCSGNVNSRIVALSHMEITNFTRKYIYLQTTRLNYVISSIPHLIALMATDVSFYIHSMISLLKTLMTTLR